VRREAEANGEVQVLCWGANQPFDPGDPTYGDPNGRHNGGNDYSFCDGHVKWMKLLSMAAYRAGDPDYLWRTQK